MYGLEMKGEAEVVGGRRLRWIEELYLLLISESSNVYKDSNSALVR